MPQLICGESERRLIGYGRQNSGEEVILIYEFILGCKDILDVIGVVEVGDTTVFEIAHGDPGHGGGGPGLLDDLEHWQHFMFH